MSKGGVIDRHFRNGWTTALILLTAWLTLGALVFDGVALSAHQHAPRRTPVISGDARHATIGDADACALCSAAAMLEPYLPLRPASFDAPQPTGAVSGSVNPTYDRPAAARAHIWRSRAPPPVPPTRFL